MHIKTTFTSYFKTDKSSLLYLNSTILIEFRQLFNSAESIKNICILYVEKYLICKYLKWYETVANINIGKMKKYSSDAVNLNVGVTNKTAEKVIVEYARFLKNAYYFLMQIMV